MTPHPAPCRGARYKTPHFATGFSIECHHPSANSPVPASGTDDHQALIDLGRSSEKFALRRIANLKLPHRLASRHIDSDQAAIEGASKELAVGICHATIDLERRSARVFDLIVMSPAHGAGRCIHRQGVGRGREIQRAVDL
jgi:hypothetical protein